MGTIATVKRERQAQLSKLQKAMKDYDAKQEFLERLIRRYRSKKKLLEAKDLPALQTAFKDMNNFFNAVERELTNLAKIVAAV